MQCSTIIVLSCHDIVTVLKKLKTMKTAFLNTTLQNVLLLHQLSCVPKQLQIVWHQRAHTTKIDINGILLKWILNVLSKKEVPKVMKSSKLCPWPLIRVLIQTLFLLYVSMYKQENIHVYYLLYTPANFSGMNSKHIFKRNKYVLLLCSLSQTSYFWFFNEKFLVGENVSIFCQERHLNCALVFL